MYRPTILFEVNNIESHQEAVGALPIVTDPHCRAHFPHLLGLQVLSIQIRTGSRIDRADSHHHDRLDFCGAGSRAYTQVGSRIEAGY